jgi:antirestriction protein
VLHGAWIDATDADIIHEGIQAMLQRSRVPGAEEWAIHDCEGFRGIRLDEYADIDHVATLGALIDQHGEAFAAYAGHVGTDYATAEGFQDSFCGEWDSEEAYAEDLFDQLYLHDIPEHLRHYVDYAAFARDLFLNDCYSVDCPEGGVFVFHRN